MKVTDRTRKALAARRELRRMTALGYRRHETDWEVNRGLGQTHKVITDAKISACGKYVYTLIGDPKN